MLHSTAPWHPALEPPLSASGPLSGPLGELNPSFSRSHLYQLSHLKFLEKVSNSYSKLQSCPHQRGFWTWAVSSPLPMWWSLKLKGTLQWAGDVGPRGDHRLGEARGSFGAGASFFSEHQLSGIFHWQLEFLEKKVIKSEGLLFLAPRSA